jgi:hypothetical protein
MLSMVYFLYIMYKKKLLIIYEKLIKYIILNITCFFTLLRQTNK